MDTNGWTHAEIRRRLALGAWGGVCALLILCVADLPAFADGEPAACDPSAMAEERERMVRRQIQDRGVSHPAVLDAMRQVPRHCFVPADRRAEAYRDHPLPIGLRQTISQPYIVAYMTELLDPKASHRVLEIGTGSGYHAAVVSKVVKEVYTVEILAPLAREAESRLRSLNMDNVHVRVGDGNEGWPEHAPFDSILVTAAAEEIPPALIRQLKPGGRMVVPVGAVQDVQRLTVLTQDAEGSVSIREVLPVRFVPLRKEP